MALTRQCELLGLPRSTYYYVPTPPDEDDVLLCHALDRLYTDHPYYGVERMTDRRRKDGYPVGPKRVRRLLRMMGLEAIYPKPRTSIPSPGHRLFPYLLRGKAISRVDEVWATDITYIPLGRRGFAYLMAVMDWYSRYVISWRLSNTMEAVWCAEVLEEALRRGRPEIHNSDQGSQFTSDVYTGVLEGAGIAISMDGRGRWMDNVFIERLWRTVKYEDIYLRGYDSLWQAEAGLGRYFSFYNEGRGHQALGRHTPGEIWRGEAALRDSPTRED
jgi:putative transposase